MLAISFSKCSLTPLADWLLFDSDVECEDGISLLGEIGLRTDAARQDLHQYISLTILKKEKSRNQ